MVSPSDSLREPKTSLPRLESPQRAVCAFEFDR